ncbi:hypothetical protein AXY43_06000 [Clostridium sp. MF28]|uniref:2-hydroxy-6-oxo-6-phenylhexa-2,4-dienoate hydrolase n=1 Tax=Clostridium diolis TaxID=223919 RepID=A0AAV3W3H6_9CLOT|nr:MULTISPECIES: alpha/beta hydrolase [Clostridium]AVK47617.1 hypothetical protein AXY43_06000 [Clostridium sp. MF28]PSM55310.1 alpha/beta hydrolase [Clostridium diolis]QES74629.1 alpha/beta hydrolase [Clostridium diolis]GEA32995.1 2-hydroxy-6-oxo-6-phenylhexa-2,4-dienoate hydrolase [Clostridium diolis]
MKYYKFGSTKNPTVFLIHGTGSHWQLSFGNVIKELTDEYHIICVAMDGHDESDPTEMISISDETHKLEGYIQKEYNGKIYGIYGSSIGGSIVGKLLERENICIDYAITGSTDFDQMAKFPAMIFCKLIIPMAYKFAKTGKISKPFAPFVKFKKIDRYLNELHDKIYNKITYETLYTEFYTDLITPIALDIIPRKTQIYCIYGTEENERKLVKRYQQHFPNSQIIGIVGLNHEELLFKEPTEWAHMIKTLLKHEDYEYYGGTKKIQKS